MSAVVTILFCTEAEFAVCSDKLLRYIRKIHPPLAHRIRATAGGHSGYG